QYLSFGYAVAAFGSEAVLIGSPGDGSGVAYLLQIPPPPLQIQTKAANSVTVSWPSPLSGFTLQENTNGLGSPIWKHVTSGIYDDGTNVTRMIAPATGSR